MKEEKSMKHWLKRKVTFTQALLVAFLITGGIGYAETTLEQLTKRVEALEKNAVHYTSIKSEESQNKNNDGAKAKDSIAIGAKAGTHVNATSAVAIGDTAKATGEAALAFGRKSVSDGKGSIAIGDEAKIASNGHSLTSIAIGKKAYVLNGTGQQEYELSFDKNNWTVTSAGFFSNTYTPKDVDKVPGGIAIGTNSYARTGSVQIGAHTVSKGSMMGGKAFVGDENANIVGMTTIGTNSYNKGALATVAGAYSIITGDFTGQGGLNSLLYGSQNFGAVTMGSLNSIRSRGYNGTAGVANSIVGLANVAENSNGALIFGAGNNISNSMKTINGVSTGADSVDDMVKQLQTAVKDSNSGGATLAIGGGNKADYTQASQLIGVNNTLTGKSGKESKYALLNGYKNAAANVENTYVTGKENTVEEAEDNLVTGKNLSLKGKEGEKAKGNILFGFNDQKKEDSMKLSAKNIVAIGNNIVAKNDNSVYLGNNSTEADSEVSKVLEEYEMETIQEHVYKYRGGKPQGIVSVGKTGEERRIQNVAAGYVHENSTDAVNGSQLYATNFKQANFMNSTETLLGGNAEVNKETGEVSMTDIGGTGKNTLHEAIAEVKKIAGDAASFTTSVSVEEELTVTKTETKDPTTEKVTNTDYKVGLSQAVKDKLNKIGDGVIAKDGEKSEHTVTGKTVYEYLEKQKEEIGVDLSNKANKDASNIEVDKFTEKLNEGANIAEPKDRLVTDRQVKDYVAGTEIAYRAEGESDSKKVKLSDGFVFQGDNNIQTETEANGVVKHTLNSELTGIKSISNEGTTITLNKENISVNDKKITGVADGDISVTSQDAVNGRQLHETNGRVERLEKDSETMKEHIVENTRQIERAKSETRHVGALSSALAALHPMQYDPLQKNQVMAGVGTYRDKQAVAVGVTHYFNENLMMTAGVSVGEAERVKTMANVGITWKIGKDDDRRDLPERYKEGPISSIYKMQQEMEEVLKENQEQKIKIQKQQEQINKMQEQLEMLLKQK